MLEHEKTQVTDRVQELKARFSDKLDEIGRRVDALRVQSRAIRDFATRPIVLLGIAAGLGLWLGSRLRGAPSGAPRRAPSVVSSPGILRAVLREVAVVAAGSATRSYVHKHVTGG